MPKNIEKIHYLNNEVYYALRLLNLDIRKDEIDSLELELPVEGGEPTNSDT